MLNWWVCSASWFGTVGQWVAAIATFIAVLIALFRDPWTKWRNKPLLTVRLTAKPPDCAKAVLTAITQEGQVYARANAFYARLWIENSGKSRAEQVQIYAARLYRKGLDTDDLQRVETFLPMNLLWAHSRPGSPENFVAIASQMGRHCDLGHVVEPALSEHFGVQRVDAVLGECKFILDVESPPATANHILDSGTYCLELRIAGSNAARITRFVNIELGGRWFSDYEEMLAQGLRVRLMDSIEAGAVAAKIEG